MAKIPANSVYNDIEVDPRPGNYYVSVVDGNQFGLLSGPYPTHAEALAKVDTCRTIAERVNDRAIWYAYGTCRMPDDYTAPGLFEKHNLMQEEENITPEIAP